MNGLRRGLLGFYSSLLMAGAVGLTVLAWNSDKQLDLSAGSFNLVAHIDANDTAKWGFTALMAAVALLGLMTFLVAAVTPATGEASRGTVRVRQPEGATVEITAAALERMLRENVERLPDVRQASARVAMRREAVESAVTAVAEPGASVAHVTNAVSNTVTATLQEQLGTGRLRPPVVRVEQAAGDGPPAAVAGRNG